MKQIITGSTCDITELLKYKNENLIASFIKSFDISEDEAEDIFESMLIFLWLSEYKEWRLCLIDSPLLIIDEMWHQFILYTSDYANFCEKYFGRFIHHYPTVPRRKGSKKPLTFEQKEIIKSKKRQRYSKIYDLIGRDVFIRWYCLYPKKYSRQSILNLRLK